MDDMSTYLLTYLLLSAGPCVLSECRQSDGLASCLLLRRHHEFTCWYEFYQPKTASTSDVFTDNEQTNARRSQADNGYTATFNDRAGELTDSLLMTTVKSHRSVQTL